MGKVHEYIKKLRIQGGYSQDEMADLMGIERSTYSNFELGKTNLFSRNLAKFARVIGKDEEDILLGEPRLRGYLSENDIAERLDALYEKVDILSRQNETLIEIINALIVKVDSLKK